jgi:hypothetical protein
LSASSDLVASLLAGNRRADDAIIGHAMVVTLAAKKPR